MQLEFPTLFREFAISCREVRSIHGMGKGIPPSLRAFARVLSAKSLEGSSLFPCPLFLELPLRSALNSDTIKDGVFRAWRDAHRSIWEWRPACSTLFEEQKQGDWGPSHLNLEDCAHDSELWCFDWGKYFDQSWDLVRLKHQLGKLH